MAAEPSEAVREIRLAGIRARHPELTERESVARPVWEEYDGGGRRMNTYTSRERFGLMAVAIVSGIGLNGVFLYGVVRSDDPLRRSRTRSLSRSSWRRSSSSRFWRTCWSAGRCPSCDGLGWLGSRCSAVSPSPFPSFCCGVRSPRRRGARKLRTAIERPSRESRWATGAGRRRCGSRQEHRESSPGDHVSSRGWCRGAMCNRFSE